MQEDKHDFFFVKSNKKTYKVKFSEICYVEGLGDYIQLWKVLVIIYSCIWLIRKLSQIFP